MWALGPGQSCYPGNQTGLACSPGTRPSRIQASNRLYLSVCLRPSPPPCPCSLPSRRHRHRHRHRHLRFLPRRAAVRMSDPRSLFAAPESPPSTPSGSPSSGPSGSSSPAAPLLPSGPRKTYLKFLFSGVPEVGMSVILQEANERTKARIQISPANVFFPRTKEKVVMVSGLPDDVLGGMAILLDKMLHKDEDKEKGAKPKVRLVIHSKFCGGIIGKGGEIVKLIIAKSLADIKVSELDRNQESQERLVTVTGNFDAQLKAIELILEELMKDVNYKPNLICPFPYGGVTSQSHRAPQSLHPPVAVQSHMPPLLYGPPSPRYSGFASQSYGAPHPLRPPVPRYSGFASQSYGAPHPLRPPVPLQIYGPPQVPSSPYTRTLGVEDAKIGLLVGHHGSNINAIMQATGTRIEISDRGDFIPGTSLRKVTITARSLLASDDARLMIQKKVSNTIERM